MEQQRIPTSFVSLEFGTPGLLTQCLMSIFAFMMFCLWYSNKVVKKSLEIPGPTPLPLIGNLLEFVFNNYDIMNTSIKIIERFNGFARIWIGRKLLVLISDPEHLQIYYTNPTMIDRADQYNHIGQVLGKDSILVANGAQWKKVRKMMIMAFHPTSTETFLKNFKVVEKDLTESFRKRADGSTFTCKFIMRTMLTNSILLNSADHKLPEEEVMELLSAADYLTHICYIRQFTLHLRHDWLFFKLAAGKKYQECFDLIINCVSDLVEKKKVEMDRMIANGEPVPNLYIYNMFRKFGDEPLELVKSELLNLLITGLDTSANTICFLLLILGQFPEIQEKIYKEDKEILKSLDGNELQVSDLEKYDYLDRVIKETLRFFPIAPIIARKLGEDTYFGKYLVKKGTDIAAMSVFTYRRPDIFPNPLKFDPDRFLPENVKQRHPYAYNPFSAGPRGCLGNRYAMIGMKTIVSGIVRNFIIQPHYNNLEELLSNAQAEITLNDKQDYPIRLLPRIQV